MDVLIGKQRKDAVAKKAIAAFASFVLAVMLCVPIAYAEAAEYSFALTIGVKDSSKPVSKTNTGSASATVSKSKSSLFTLKGGVLVLRVRTKDGEMASDSATYKSCTTKKMAYWSGYGNKQIYKLYGQIDSSSSVKSGTAGGIWTP